MCDMCWWTGGPRLDLIRFDSVRYSLAATRSASGTATLAAPIIRRMELTASQCLAASNPASFPGREDVGRGGVISIHDDQGFRIDCCRCYWQFNAKSFAASLPSSSPLSSSWTWWFIVRCCVVAFCVCANCRDSGIDYSSNNNDRKASGKSGK